MILDQAYVPEHPLKHADTFSLPNDQKGDLESCETEPASNTMIFLIIICQSQD